MFHTDTGQGFFLPIAKSERLILLHGDLAIGVVCKCIPQDCGYTANPLLNFKQTALSGKLVF